jgi:2-dehydro-3-deoxyglucarate aldolase/4-hydroxy-2-oxoheptanedioate aldolase
MSPASLKSRLAAGETLFGTMVFEFDSPGLARIVAGAGADFIILDMEHSGWGVETIKRQIAHAHGAGLPPIVNPPGAAHDQICRPLDLGAIGVMVPVVETREQAEAIVRATRYPPLGTRGSAFGVAHDGYSVGDVAATMAAANERTLVIVKIETATGIANADAIMSLPGVDVGFVGHTDLSVSLGNPGEFDNPAFIAARDAVAASCRKHRKAAGCLVATPESGRQWVAAGFRLVTYLGDIWLLANALRSGLDAMRAPLPSGT